MKHTFLRLFIGIIIFASVNLSAQNKQYTLDKEKAQINLIVNKEKTTFTVADIAGWKKGRPLPESKLYKLDINSDTIGIWESPSTDKSTWKLVVNVPGAKGFFISFDEFYLPKDSKLYAYSKDDSKNAIIFSHEDNPDGGAYSLEGLKGDNVVLEYMTSTPLKEAPKLHLRNIGYKYTDNLGNELSGFNSSKNSCMINVNCPEGDLWDVQRRGVLQLRMTKSDNKTYLCSGSLVNNTSNDKTPYVLTAYHCFENMTKEQIEQTEFFFEYESPTCEENTLPIYKYHKGSEILVLNPIKNGSDGALLKLSENIPNDWDVYFNGWDRENTGSNIKSGSIIHHPLGDVKKITFYEAPLTSSKWNDNAPNGTHWIAYYSVGSTAGGSSGSPIFNQNGLIVGTLTGGDTSCSSPNMPDYFGKFWFHWNKHPDSSIHMNKYLDPANTDVKKIAGLYNNDNIIKDILLDQYDIDMTVSTLSTIKILSGNGGYKIVSSDESVAAARLENSTIKIDAKKLGTTVITISDRKDKSKDITISVHNPIDFVINDQTLEINVYEDDDSIKEIRLIDLDGDVFYNKKNLEDKVHTLNLNTFKKGRIYILQIKTHSGISKTEKIIW